MLKKFIYYILTNPLSEFNLTQRYESKWTKASKSYVGVSHRLLSFDFDQSRWTYYATASFTLGLTSHLALTITDAQNTVVYYYLIIEKHCIKKIILQLHTIIVISIN